MQSSQQSMQAFLPHSLKEYQGLLLLRSVLCEIPYEGVLVDSEFDFTVNLDEDGSVLDLIDGSVDSACGLILVCRLAGGGFLRMLLLLLALRTDHKLPHDHHQVDDHDPERATTGTLRLPGSSRSGGLQQCESKNIHF